jgi:putative ABC transport system permease protein
MNSLWQDIRFGVRMLAKNPGFTGVVVLTLALGIGANTAIFSVVNAVILEPLPFPEGKRLVALRGVDLRSGEKGRPLSYPDFADLRAQSHALESLAAYNGATFTLTGAGEPLHIEAGIVSANLFDVLRVSPMLGRAFASTEHQAGTRVVLLSHRLWKTRFGANANIVGRQVTLDAQPYTVAGVMPPEFQFPLASQPMDLWATMAVNSVSVDPEGPLTNQRGAHFLHAIGRLQAGFGLAQANAETAAIGAVLEKQYPDTDGHLTMALQPEIDALVGDVQPVLLMVLGAVGFLLLIACSNAANLLLARAAGRQREIAIRASLGAGRARVLRQLLTESVLLSVGGGALGLLLAVWGTSVLTSFRSLQIPRLAQAGLDARALGFTLGVSLLTGLLFGLAPAWHASRFDLFGSLKEGGRANTEGKGHSRVRSLLVVSQVSLAMVLLVGASLLLESMFHLLQQSPGFDAKGVLAVNLDLPDVRYGKPEQSADFFQLLLGRIRALPGVQSASGVLPLPLANDMIRTTFEIEGRPVAKSDEPRTQFRAVGLDYFRTMRIPLLEGRDFTPRDDRHATSVILINQSLARRFFPNESPIGKHIKPGVSASGPEVMREIVGVVGDVKHRNLWQATEPEVYAPYDQVALGAMYLVVRSAGEPMSLLPAIPEQVRALDTELPIYKAQELEEYVSASVAQRRFTSLLVSAFAGAGLLLATVGLFGLMSYSVEQRRNEIGIRVAVGAEKSDILRLIVREGLGLTLAGIAIGLAGTFGVSRILKSQLFGISATDPMTFLVVALALVVVAVTACYIPAWRAAHIDPLVALRNE